MAKAVGALHPNTGDERRRLYERARTALLTELRSADPSDIIAAQMLLELAIGEVEADAERDQRARQTMDDPSTVWPPDSEPGREPEMISLTRLRAEEAQPGA
jgi:predicted ATPase